jgi:hypothetical protein
MTPTATLREEKLEPWKMTPDQVVKLSGWPLIKAKAWLLSVAHWQRLVNGLPDEEVGPEHCALCDVFARAPHFCQGCPVAEKTDLSGCGGTPYAEAEFAFKKHGLHSKRFKTAARKELAFLKSLLPKGGK